MDLRACFDLCLGKLYSADIHFRAPRVRMGASRQGRHLKMLSAFGGGNIDQHVVLPVKSISPIRSPRQQLAIQ